MSGGGIKYDQSKPDMSLIPVAALLDEAGLWTKGKAKYAAFNWYNGLMYRRVLSAIGRHLALMNAGIDIDSETKHLHASAIRCGCAMLVQFTLENRTELDDRLKLPEEAKAKIEAMSQGEFLWDLLKPENAEQAVLEATADANAVTAEQVTRMAATEAKAKLVSQHEVSTIVERFFGHN